MGDLRERIEALALLEEARVEAANAKQAIDGLLSKVTVEAIASIVEERLRQAGMASGIAWSHAQWVTPAVVAWIKGEEG